MCPHLRTEPSWGKTSAVTGRRPGGGEGSTKPSEHDGYRSTVGMVAQVCTCQRMQLFSLKECSLLCVGCNTIKLLGKTQRKAGNPINYFSESRPSASSKAMCYNFL